MMNQPTHAALVNDNFDGENNRYWVFAYEREGVFYSFENNEPLLKHDGDEILKMTSLSVSTENEDSMAKANIVNTFVDACFAAEGDIEDTLHMWDLSDVRKFAKKYNKAQR